MPSHDGHRRSLLIGLAAAITAFAFVASPMGHPQTADAAGCVRFVASNFDAPGNDNYAANLNKEWVRIKNFCSATRSLSGWTIKDYKSKHTYTFATSVKIKVGKSITLYSGRGTNTASKRFWGRSYGAVWNNTPPEYAYLRSAGGSLQSRWTEY